MDDVSCKQFKRYQKEKHWQSNLGDKIVKLTKQRLKEIIKEELLREENESAWTFIYKGMLGGFKKAGLKGTRFDSSLDSVAHAAAFLIKTQFGGGAKNDFIKLVKKHIK